jgi:putative SOS response-associated peptidase YedK
MCGRVYEIYTDEKLSARYLSGGSVSSAMSTPVYNLCPTQESPVLRVTDGNRRFDRMRWQLVPPDEPSFTTKLSTINARSEGVFHSIHLRDKPIMRIAGLWSAWRAGTSQERHSFTIITTAANDFMSEIHSRMPVILESGAERAWLDANVRDREKLQAMMKPRPGLPLAVAEVSTLVNTARNNGPELLEAVTSRRATTLFQM